MGPDNTMLTPIILEVIFRSTTLIILAMISEATHFCSAPTAWRMTPLIKRP